MVLKSWDSGLHKTRQNVFSRISQIFKGSNKITDELFDELEAVLIESDVGVEMSFKLIDALRSFRIDGDNTADQIRMALKKMIQDQLIETLPFSSVQNKPHVTMVVGVNGTGKTTTIGKLAWKMRQAGQRVLLAGADTFRAAAAEQLEIWADRAGADCIRQKSGADPASVAFDALDAAIARHMDILFVDTAGRLHNKANLMEELKKIRRVLDKRLSGAPHSTLLVLDAITGQNGLRQAEQFAKDVGVTEVALTKLDGTARGGIVLAIKERLGIPVRWIGVGESIEDILPFDAHAFVEAMFGE